MNVQPLKHDPHKTSFYITDALYEELIADFANWQRDELVISRHGRARPFRRLLEHEARLLDQDRLEDWLQVVHAGMRLLGAVEPDRRRSAERNRHHLRRPPAAGRPRLPAAHRLCLVAEAEIAHRAHGQQCRGVRCRPHRHAHGALEFHDRRVPRLRNPLPLSGWCGHRFVEARRDAGRSRCGSST